MIYSWNNETEMWEWDSGPALLFDDNPAVLQTRLILGVAIGIGATMLIAHILFQMEKHNASYKEAALEAVLEDDKGNDNSEHIHQLALQEEEEGDGDFVNGYRENQKSQDRENNDNKIAKQNRIVTEDSIRHKGPRRRLSNTQRLQITATVTVLILFNYLLLVFQPGSIYLSFLGMILLWILTLYSYWRDEIQRRGRYDRCIAMVALFFIIAGCLTLITFCRLSLREGGIYQGPARIVGYDNNAYNNSNTNTILRANLQISWGGSWGCPYEDGKFCNAMINGALCDGDGTNDIAATDGDTLMTETLADEEINAIDSAAEEEINEMEDEDSETIDELTDKLNDEEDVVWDTFNEVIGLEGNDNATVAAAENTLVLEIDSEACTLIPEEVANEKLKKSNEEIESEIAMEEEYEDELGDELEELEESEYSFDDDVYEDSYWQKQDWDSVWGEYACMDLFDTDLKGATYKPEDPPGNDQWPTIMIYGSCSQCQAYMQDYYSTGHFQSIRSFEVQSWVYLFVGFFLLVLSAVATLFAPPVKEAKVILLSHDGGVEA